MFRNFVNPVKNSSNNIIECLWQHTLLHFSRIQMAIRIREDQHYFKRTIINR